MKKGVYFKFPTLLDHLLQRLPTDQNPTGFVEGNDYLFGEEIILMDKVRMCPDGTDCLSILGYLNSCLYCLLIALYLCGCFVSYYRHFSLSWNWFD